MKKIYTAILISAILQACTTLIPPTQTAPAVLQKSAYLPVCESASSTSTDQSLYSNKKTPQSSMHLVNTCIVELPENLQTTPYCINKETQIGGVNIKFPKLKKEGYLAYPKNCYTSGSPGKWDAMLVCSGKAGSAVNISVSNSCQPPSATRPDVEPSCPPKYSKNPKDGYCTYTAVPPPTPYPIQSSCPAGYKPENKSCGSCIPIDSSQRIQRIDSVCPTNYAKAPKDGCLCVWSPPKCSNSMTYNIKSNCCAEIITPPNTLSACPEGYKFNGSVCQPINKGSFSIETRTYKVILGDCPINRQTEKLQPACIPNPATGACN